MTSILSKLFTSAVKILDDHQGNNDMLIHTTNLKPHNSTLKVYVYGRYNSKFRFVYEDDDSHQTKKVTRVLMDRMPMSELRTGIHDKTLTDFTGTCVKFFK